MARHFIAAFWMLSCAWCILLGVANIAVAASVGAAKADAAGTHNYSLFLGEVFAGDETQRRNSLGPEEGADRTDAMDYGPLQPVHVVKRAPSGFLGMRGKKNDFLDVSNNAQLFNQWAHNENDQNDDDKKQENDDQNAGVLFGRRLKKAPSAFYGVRGKKYTNDYSNGNNYSPLRDVLRQLQEKQARDLLVQEFIDRLATATAKLNDVEKRAPTGFMGMRGKRPEAEGGFFGDNVDADADADGSLVGKRAPANAFVAVRGKKDVSDGDDHQAFKRSPGEKSRTKNQRFVDFTNKFVAVRGKKNLNDILDGYGAETEADADANAEAGSDEQDNMLVGAGDEGAIISPLRQRYYVNLLPSLFSYGPTGKRTPSGFLGMRGKRSATLAVDDVAAIQ